MKFIVLLNLKSMTIANSFLQDISEHENAKFCKHLSYLFAENNSCSVGLSSKNSFFLILGCDPFNLYYSLGLFNRRHTDDIFCLIFARK